VPIGGSQDAWGSVYPGINLLHYDFRHHNGVLPKTVTSITNQRTATWFERNFWIVPCVGPRPEGYNPFEGNPVSNALTRFGSATSRRWATRLTNAPAPGERCYLPSSNIAPSRFQS
jgi:hypothetical protein